MRFLADENFNRSIVRQLSTRHPNIDILRVQEAGLSGMGDAAVLAFAHNDNRIVLTHDYKTIPELAYKWLSNGLPIPGIFMIDWYLPIGTAINALDLILVCSEQPEWSGKIQYLPF